MSFFENVICKYEVTSVINKQQNTLNKFKKKLQMDKVIQINQNFKYLRKMVCLKKFVFQKCEQVEEKFEVLNEERQIDFGWFEKKV